MFAPKKILVPTDFSKYADKALKQAYEMAKQYKAKIYLLHATSVSQACSIDYCLDPQTIERLDKEIVESAETMMQKQIKRVIKSNDVEIIQSVTKGTPYEQILKEQQSKKVDLIVIASQSKTGILSHLIGSVAEKVLRGATCPVVLVKGK